MGCGSSTGKLESSLTSLSHFQVERILGKGAFGKVKAVVKKTKSDKGEWYAMKFISKKQIAKAGANSSEVEQIFNELTFMKKISKDKFRYVVNIHYAFQDSMTCYLISDLALGGDMRFNLNKVWRKTYPDGMPEKHTRTYVAQIVCALQFLHGYNILHRDIKPENILLDAEGKLKLADFGISSYMDDKGLVYKRSGTREYMAPEIISASDHAHGTDSDFFCVGVILYELILYRRPTYWEGKFLQRDDPNTMKTRLQKKKVSDECVDLILKLMEVRKDRRLGYGETLTDNGKVILEHKFFEGLDVEEVKRGDAPVHFFPNTKQANVEGSNDIVEQFGLERQDTLKLSDEQQKLFDGFHYDKIAEMEEATGMTDKELRRSSRRSVEIKKSRKSVEKPKGSP